ncbi:ThiF family adenylyltransferase [Bythopirellula polymerisocia]|uniref:Molybdopterin-synthase adenylyltransferase n=1 Tax=Bythopirellula polymerisocia TaxID=2528003 RepID=A0A5C6CSH1_9BACT|nr:ThiF family adenylyltransferase [Bythopirellula polymerisocia]TWU25769.1 Molybdopterin-synthase adenylyltransferase [Bythopirellula polymerisocia]
MEEAANIPDRYIRQTRFAPFGVEGQQRLSKARMLICGCGALGSVVADQLVRAGVGYLRIVDRDFVELDNLHRQVLFSEQDAADQLPKAIAAHRRLGQVNSQVEIDSVVADVDAANIRQLATDMDVLVDGTDNFETRYLLNDLAVEQGLPWVFAGCVGAEGQTMAILPGQTPCLSCFLPEPPPASSQPTCETAGVLGPLVGVIASLQATEALKLGSGNAAAVNPYLTVLDLWNNQLRSINMAKSRRADCPTCGERKFPWLKGEKGAAVTSLCGRNSVQISPTAGESVDLAVLAERLGSIGRVTTNPYLVRLAVGDYLLTVFADGRTIVGGTDDPALARTLHAKYVGI